MDENCVSKFHKKSSIPFSSLPLLLKLSLEVVSLQVRHERSLEPTQVVALIPGFYSPDL